MALKDFREFHLKMNQQQFAEYLGLSLKEITRLEENPDEIPYGVLKTLADKTGMTLDEITCYERPRAEPLKPENTWSSADFTRKKLVDYINHFSDKWHEIWRDLYRNHIDELNTGVKSAIRKPKIAIVGRSDVGKSTLINCILGSEKMPVSWTPTTSIVVYIKHIDDRPTFIKDNVWIFKRKEQGIWDENCFEDEAYCAEWKLNGGDINILQSYGTHTGNKFDENEVGSAIVFIDSDVLKDCDIIDLPGYGTGHENESQSVTLEVTSKADVLIYMSLANGFMRDEDFCYLQNVLKDLKPIESAEHLKIPFLGKLFVVASHAKAIDGGNPDSLKKILDRGCSDFYKSLSDNFLEERGCTKEALRKRFFTFSPEIPDLCAALNKTLQSVIEILPRLINEKAILFVKDFAKSKGICLDEEIKSYQSMISDKEKYEKLLEEIDKAEPSRMNTTQNARKEVNERIKDFRRESISDFADQYTKVVSIDEIVKTIERKELKNKKEDRNILASHISSTLQSRLDSVLKRKSEELGKVIDDYISGIEATLMSDKINSLGINFNFNTKVAFASGFAGLATIGGLAIWASTLGNLGAYILVAKGVSILSALGISISGGTAAAVAFVSSIGGPIVLGIALAVIAAVTVFAIFSGGWKKSLAKQIVKAYDKEKALEKYKQAIGKFWDDTQKAFDLAADNMEKEWKNHVNNLRGMIKNYDIDDLSRRIQAAWEMKDFFTNIPL